MGRFRPFSYLRRRPDAVAAEVDEELRAHLEMRTEELRAAGMPEEEARAEARRAFGDLEATREYCRRQDEEKERRMHRLLVLEDLRQDLGTSLRSLGRARGMAAVIVGTVGLGIGATTLAFAVVHAALLRPLAYAAPEELVRVYTDAPPNRFRFSVVDYQALAAQQTQFARIAGYTERAMAWSDGATAERVRGREVTWAYFDTLGLRPALGPGFTEADARRGNPRAVVVSHGFWQSRLGGRADAVGRPVRLDGLDYTLAGVLPREVGPLERGQEFFVAAQWDEPRRRGPFLLTVVGRLRDAAGRAAAADELRAINRRIFPLWAASYQNEKATWSLMDLKAHVVGDLATTAGLALGSVALVWLIACANASNLLVARVASRRRELAVRAALGASRMRILGHLAAESAVLAAGAALLGVALAWAGIRLLAATAAAYVPRVQEARLDGPVLAVLVALTAASTLLFGLVPALHGTRAPIDETLRDSGRSATAGFAVRRLRRILVAGQFAVATPLLVAATLLLASLDALGRVDLGFDSRGVVSGTITLPAAQYADPGRGVAFFEELERRVEALPGVTGATFADGRPPVEVGNFNNFDLEDAPTPPGGSQPVTPWVDVTPDYFRVLGLPLLEGRLFDEHDLDPNAYVVVDRAWARRFFPNGSAVGKRLRSGGCTTCPWTTVIGVVGEVKYAGLDAPDQGTVYTVTVGRTPDGAIDQPSARFRYLVVRATADPDAVLPMVRQAVNGLDPTVPFANAASMDEVVARSLERPRSLSFLVAGFALVALALSVVGIYGVMSFYVQQHARDIAIRLALGGTPSGVVGLVVGQGMTVVALGVAVGLLAAFAVARLIAGLLFGIAAHDPAAYGGVSLLLSAAALAACVLPAWRCARLAPADVLRAE